MPMHPYSMVVHFRSSQAHVSFMTVHFGLDKILELEIGHNWIRGPFLSYPWVIEGHPGLKSSKFSSFKLFVLFGIVCICLIWLEVQLLFAIDEYFLKKQLYFKDHLRASLYHSKL